MKLISVFFAAIIFLTGCNSTLERKENNEYSKIKPDWFDKKDYQEGDKYYFIGRGARASSEEKSKSEAISNAYLSIARLTGMDVKVLHDSLEISDNQNVYTKNKEKIRAKSSYNISDVLIEDFYSQNDNDKYITRVLVSVSFEEIERLKNNSQLMNIPVEIEGIGFSSVNLNEYKNKEQALFRAKMIAEAYATTQIASKVGEQKVERTTSGNQFNSKTISSSVLENLKTVEEKCGIFGSEVKCKIRLVSYLKRKDIYDIR